tara:strand:+ start:533 stop:727 length:195 start_codon:yes stop_codon:yes gene_type:complete
MRYNMVSSCCGDEYEEIEDENCEEQIVCIACGDYCETIEEYEYKEQQREKYEEERADEKRKYGE